MSKIDIEIEHFQFSLFHKFARRGSIFDFKIAIRTRTNYSENIIDFRAETIFL